MSATIEDELAALRAENEVLRARLADDRAEAAATDASGPGAGGPAAGPSGRRPGRRLRWAIPSAALIVIGAILAPVSIVATWAGREVGSTDTFVATFAPLARDPAVQRFVAAQTLAVVERNVDIDQLTGTVFDGIGQLDLPPRAKTALAALEAPAADGIRNLLSTTVARFVASPQFARLWTDLLRTGHTQMIASLSGDRQAAVSIGEDGSIGIELGPVVAAVKERLVDRGLTFAERIPDVNRTIVVATSDAAVRAQTAYTLLLATATWLPWLVVVCIGLGVVMARRRSRALTSAAIGVALASLATLAALGIGRVVAVRALAPELMPRNAARVIYDHVVATVLSASIAVTVLALSVALVAWFAGGSAPAGRLRGAFGRAAAALRARAESVGFTTGVVGEQLYRGRVLVRTLVALGAAAIIVFQRPLSPSVIVWTLVGALVVVAIVELVARPARVPVAVPVPAPVVP